MKLSKLLLAFVAATLLLGVLVGSTSARIFSFSSILYRHTWSTLNIAGGFGTIECAVFIEGSLHSRTQTKTGGTLIGYVTAAGVVRCTRGGATIDSPALPWHERYEAFSGTLPNITGLHTTFSSAALRLREPTFGVTCQISGASVRRAYRSTAGVLTEVSLSGTAPCGPTTGTISGSTTNVDNRAGARITVTLI